ncbi:putative hydrolase PNKD [Platysternon megacephalum]|uniref:Putative hydrolase PNKD n=1 Tax=Platysternon megacephalum TaxID=55544 RepID=A0A4D9E855_9SAUR|nr:putative hydrolase PNKD [Platysternon megacephalum]
MRTEISKTITSGVLSPEGTVLITKLDLPENARSFKDLETLSLSLVWGIRSFPRNNTGWLIYTWREPQGHTSPCPSTKAPNLTTENGSSIRELTLERKGPLHGATAPAPAQMLKSNTEGTCCQCPQEGC